ncbi:MAG: hypothetical protein MJY71_02000 [Bacteroidaceae bacterium]|nr:hypothetical protein [Bacteroidaceae bacterium]
MKKIFFAIACTAVLVSCTRTELIPGSGSGKEPEPVVSRLDEYAVPFKVYNMLCKTDANTKITVVESWDGKEVSGQESYVGCYQCFDAHGNAKWPEWVHVTDLPTEQYINTTVFDITTDGNIIDCYNVKDVETGAQLPYVQKITWDGHRAWGQDGNGILFYTFKQDLEHQDENPIPPCEGYVAADHNGGAWIAAGNGADSIIVARVDRNGNISNMIKFDANGTLGKKDYVFRPQMMVGADDELFLLMLYADIEGTMYNGYCDIIKISNDGRLLQRSTLMPQKFFTRGLYGQISPDGKGGAYVLFKASDGFAMHLYMEHFDKDGNVDFNDIDLNPKGATGNRLDAMSVTDQSTGNCCIVYIDDSSIRSRLYVQFVSPAGNVLLGKDGDPLLAMETREGDFLIHSSAFKLFYNPTDCRLHLYYAIDKAHCAREIKAHTLSSTGELSKARDVVELFVDQLADGYEDGTDAVIDGHFRMWWLKSNSKKIYSYCDQL